MAVKPLAGGIQPGMVGPPPGAPGAERNETVEELNKLKLWDKFKTGDFHSITRDHVKELFEILREGAGGNENDKEIDAKELDYIRRVKDLNMTDDEIKALIKECDRDGNGKVTVEELYKALAFGQVAFNLIKNQLNTKRKKAQGGRNNECERDEIIDWLHEEYETSSALWSLPQTIMLFFIFVLSMMHLAIPRAYQMQNAIKAEIEGEGAPTHDLRTYVHDVYSYMEWLRDMYAPANFRQDLVAFPFPGRTASYNQIIGGVQFVKNYYAADECPSNDLLRTLYDSITPGACYRKEMGSHSYVGDATLETDSVYLLYHERLEDLQERIWNLTGQDLENPNWIDLNATLLDIAVLYYNANLQMYTAHHLKAFWNNDGFPQIIFDAESFLSDPYANKLWIIPDAIFTIILLKMLYAELKELIPACMNGFDGFIAYLEFWNIIDWLSIIFGIVCIVFWGIVVKYVSFDIQESMQRLPARSELDHWVYSNVTYMLPQQFDEVADRQLTYNVLTELHGVMDEIAAMHGYLRIITFFYNFVLMMKFFKAFQANPMLDCVIQTLLKSYVELVHFFIVFLCIFVVFSTAAHVVFGPSVQEFSDMYRSFITCWRVLMGDVGVDREEFIDQWAYLYDFWVVLFELLVLLILLNMLLAIIMDKYQQVTTGAGPNSLTIWAQVFQAIKTVQETRGHLDLWYLICEFEDDDYPAHPTKTVTSKTLRRAFERDKMTRHNSDYIIRETQKFVKNKEGECELSLSDSLRITSQVLQYVKRIESISEKVYSMFQEQRDRPHQARLDAIMSGKDPDAPGVVGGHPVPVMPYGTPSGHGMPALTNMPGQVPMGHMATGVPMQAQLTDATLAGHQAALMQHQPTGNAFANVASAAAGLRSPIRRDTGGSVTSIATGGASRRHIVAAGDDEQQAAILQTMKQMQATIEQMHNEQYQFAEGMQEQLREQQEAATQTKDWLEHRMNALERRCEKVERASDRLCAQVAAVDFDELTLNTKRLAGGQVNYVSSATDNEASTPGKNFGAPRSEGVQPGRLEKKVDRLAEQVQQLVQQGEETANARQLLWKVELHTRQMKNSITNTEQLMGNVCKLMVGVDDKVAGIGANRRGGGGFGHSPQPSPVHQTGEYSSISHDDSTMTTVDNRLRGAARGAGGAGGRGDVTMPADLGTPGVSEINASGPSTRTARGRVVVPQDQESSGGSHGSQSSGQRAAAAAARNGGGNGGRTQARMDTPPRPNDFG